MNDITPAMAAKFWKRVDRRGLDECWPWLGGSRNPKGYASFHLGGGRKTPICDLVHRIAYRLAVGPIPNGLTIDHVAERGCHRKDCCNPRHLEAVTRGENARRHFRLQTHCKRGHLLDGDNVQRLGGEQRRCRVCRRKVAA